MRINCSKRLIRLTNPLPFPQAYDKTAYYTKKFGASGAPAVLARVRREAAALGLSLTFEGRTGNTRDSHLLLLLAQRRSQRHLAALQAALFRGAFEEGRDISDRGFLLEAAAAAGLVGPGGGDGEREDVLARLDGPEGMRLVDGLERRAKAVVGIAAVPSFVVQGRYRVGGKQEEGVFLDLFERIRREDEGWVKEGTEETHGERDGECKGEGEVCGVDSGR